MGGYRIKLPPGELTAAFLSVQLDEANVITKKRLDIWKKYYEIF